jgi:hypothetical protein
MIIKHAAKNLRQPLQKKTKIVLNKIIITNSGIPPMGGSVIAERRSIIKLAAIKYG